MGARILPEFAGKVQVITIVTGVKSPYILGKAERPRASAAQIKFNELGIEVFA